ncbi:MAG TPA: 5-formyltetrahydrofolate cyclo-ligase [Usitatibacter sp.]|nr:5-formyltetrahydrofolate cyclo-ligase [Usitatibacter sp.]
MTQPPDVAAWRAAERKRLLELRAAIPLEQRREDDARMTQLLLDGFPQLRGMIVGFYWPMKGEFDPRVAVLRLREQGGRAALPIVVQKAAPLQYREWWPGVATTPGVFNLPVPVDTPVLVPQAVFMPPVGFDARGYRLGYGGGYFDRTLASFSPQPLKIGVGREMNRIATIYPQAFDVPMDFVVTEAGIHEVTPAGLRRLG